MFANGNGTRHTCLWLVSCYSLDPFSTDDKSGEDEEVPCPPSFVAVWDGDVLATVSPQWVLRVVVERVSGSENSSGKCVLLQGTEATRQFKKPGSFASICKETAKAPVFRAVAMHFDYLPDPVKGVDLGVLHGAAVAAMLPQKWRAALKKQHPALVPFATANEACGILHGQNAEFKGSACLQIADTYMPPAVTLLSVFVRPSAARSLTGRQIHALCALLDEYPTSDGKLYAAGTCDLFAMSSAWAGRGLPTRPLSLQRDFLEHGGHAGQEWRKEIAQARAALHRARATPTLHRPVRLLLGSAFAGDARLDATLPGHSCVPVACDAEPDTSEDDFTGPAGGQEEEKEAGCASGEEASTGKREGEREKEDLPPPASLGDAPADCPDEVTLSSSAYDAVAADFLLRESTSLAAWCGSPSAFLTDGHLESFSFSHGQAVFVAPNDAYAIVYRELGVETLSAGDVTAGRAQFLCNWEGGGKTAVFFAAHLYGCRGLAELCSFFPRSWAFLFVGDPQHGFGSYDETDGGAPFRDAWTTNAANRWWGGQRLYGAFSRKILPDSASVGALFAWKDSFVVTENASDNDSACGTRFWCGYGRDRVGEEACARKVTLVAGANTSVQAYGGDWKAATTVSEGDTILLPRLGELRVVRATGRFIGEPGSGHFARSNREGLSLRDPDAYVHFAPASGTRDHRLCCGTDHADVASLFLHAAVKGNRLPIRVVAGSLPPCSLPENVQVVLEEVPATGKGNEDEGAECVSVDDVRVACKLATSRVFVLTRRSLDDVFASRAKRKARGALFEFLSDPGRKKPLDESGLGEALQRHAADVEAAVALSTRTVGAVVSLARERDKKEPEDGAGGQVTGSFSGQAFEKNGPVFDAPPPANVLQGMLTSDFENALRDRLNALLDASQVGVNANEDGEEVPSWTGSAARYPFAGRFARLLPAAREQLLTDGKMRERVAVVAACKVCRGDRTLERWLVGAEEALCEMRAVPRSRKRLAAAQHRENVQKQLDKVKPLRRVGNCSDEDDGEEQDSLNEMERALLRVQSFLRGILSE